MSISSFVSSLHHVANIVMVFTLTIPTHFLLFWLIAKVIATRTDMALCIYSAFD